MKGRQVEYLETFFSTREPGDYCKVNESTWFLISPAGGKDKGHINNRIWTIIEHDDGTITVAPSIWFNKDTNGWHGYLEKGEWRQV